MQGAPGVPGASVGDGAPAGARPLEGSSHAAPAKGPSSAGRHAQLPGKAGAGPPAPGRGRLSSARTEGRAASSPAHAALLGQAQRPSVSKSYRMSAGCPAVL